MKKFILALLLIANPASAQWQVQNHAIPMGRGAGVTGFGSAIPGAANLPFVSNGAAADPSFKRLPNVGLAQMPASTVKCNPTAGTADAQDCTAAQTATTIGAATLAGNNIWTGNNAFGSGVPWCDVTAKGAVHDGTTDDTGAFNACKTQCLTTLGAGSCIIYVPPASNVYCLKTGFAINTGLTTNGGIILMGGGVQGSNLSACGANTAPVVFINNQWAQIRSLSVYGYGTSASDPVFSGGAPLFPAVQMASGCSQCRIQDAYITGGIAAIQNNGACGYVIDNVWGSFSYGDGSHVFGFFYQISCGGVIRDSHFDMVYPVSQPAHGTAIAARANLTPYAALGTIVSVTCNTRTFYIQLATAGTSAAAFPGCKPFSAPIADGTAVWQLVNAATSYCVQLDTGSIETELIHVDATCAADSNIAFTNTFAGQAPQQNSIIRSTPGGAFSSDLLIDAGVHTTIIGLETSFCMLAGCSGLLIDNANVSGVNIIDIDCLNGFAFCVNITAAANNISVQSMHSTGADTADFNLGAVAATSFKVVNSTHVSGAGSFATLGAAGSDHWIIQNNICNGATITNNSTGAHKSLQTCGGGTDP